MGFTDAPTRPAEAPMRFTVASTNPADAPKSVTHEPMGPAECPMADAEAMDRADGSSKVAWQKGSALRTKDSGAGGGSALLPPVLPTYTMAAATRKVSVAMGREELRLAKVAAREEGVSLSAFLTRAVRDR